MSVALWEFIPSSYAEVPVEVGLTYIIRRTGHGVGIWAIVLTSKWKYDRRAIVHCHSLVVLCEALRERAVAAQIYVKSSGLREWASRFRADL